MDTSACPNSDPSCGDYGLVSGRITALAVNPAVSGGTDVWAGAADGGLWHSTDGGTTWVPALDAAATGTDSPAESIGAISFNPNDPSEMFVGTGEANGSDSVLGVGIYYSQDGGQTFTLYGQSLLSELGIAKIAVSSSLSAPYVLAAASNTYAVGNGGVYLSTDNTTWSPVISGVSATDVVYDPNTPTVAYAGLAAKFVKGSNGKVTSSPVMRSTQSGKLKSWTPVDLGLPNNTQIRRTTLGISADGTHIYAVLVNQNGDLQGGAIYYSTDSGKTWQALAVPSDMASDSGGDQWWYDSTITVNPTNSSDVYVGGVDIWWWGPGTSYSWTNVTSVYGIGPGANTYNVHPDQHAMANIPGSATFYDGNDGGVWKATPPAAGGWSFANLNGGGLDITQFYSGSIGMVGGYPQLYGGAQDNGESFSTAPFDSFNSPVQWSETFGGDGGDTAVDYTNNAIVYEEVFQGDMFKSTTTGSGQSWTEAINGIDICANGEGHSCPATPYDSVSEVMPFVLSPSNHNELFAGTDRVYQTTDGANTWTAISPQLDPYPCTSSCDTNVCNGTVNSATCYWPLTAVAVAPNSDAQLYAGDQHGNIFATSAGFSGWTTAGTGTPSGAAVTGLAVDPTDSLIVYATYAGYLGDDVYQSKDGGGDWSSISGTMKLTRFDGHQYTWG